MDILFFERMRIFKGDGGRVLFRLRLPRSSEGCEELDTFYSELCAAYIEVAEKLAQTVNEDVYFTVSFSADIGYAKVRKHSKRKKNKEALPDPQQLVIRRTVSRKSAQGESINSVTDVFDLSLGLFIK